MINIIKKECSEFLQKSDGLPLLKNLPKDSRDIKKVKVRHKKNKNKEINSVVNKVFDKEENLIQKAVFGHGPDGFIPVIDEEVEPYYIFPINGFKYMYAPFIQNTTREYKATLNKLMSISEDLNIEVFNDILKYNYIYDNLNQGLLSSSEIIVFDISYYYAAKYSYVDDYLNKFYN